MKKNYTVSQIAECAERRYIRGREKSLSKMQENENVVIGGIKYSYQPENVENLTSIYKGKVLEGLEKLKGELRD